MKDSRGIQPMRANEFYFWGQTAYPKSDLLQLQMYDEQTKVQEMKILECVLCLTACWPQHHCCSKWTTLKLHRNKVNIVNALLLGANVTQGPKAAEVSEMWWSQTSSLTTTKAIKESKRKRWSWTHLNAGSTQRSGPVCKTKHAVNKDWEVVDWVLWRSSG